MRASSRALALCCSTAFGCIPSHRLVHEGDSYFERCYGADYETRVPDNQKEACWSSWIAHYTKHQPAHRVDYAMRRIEALQAGEPGPRLPGLGGEVVSSAQTESELAAASAAASNSGSLLISGSVDNDAGPVPNGCLNVCNQYESRCAARCPTTSTACKIGCERERAVCLNGCH